MAQTETEEDPDRLQQLAGAGLTPEVVNRLAQLNAVEFHTLCSMKSKDLTLILNPEGLLLNIRSLEASREERVKFNYFLHNGASPAMVMRLFRGVSHGSIRRQRTLMGINTPFGRPPVPKDKERREIEDAWCALKETHPRSQPNWERERFFSLHKRYSHHSLATLDAVVNTFRTQTGHAE